jgi:hypothetical protein
MGRERQRQMEADGIIDTAQISPHILIVSAEPDVATAMFVDGFKQFIAGPSVAGV